MKRKLLTSKINVITMNGRTVKITAMIHVLCSNETSNSYIVGCPPVRGDNPRALARELSYVQVHKHGIIILYHLMISV